MIESLRSYAWTFAAAAIAVFAGAVLLALPATLPTGDVFTKDTAKKPSKEQASGGNEPSPISDDVDDPAAWGKVFPLHFELYLKTVDMHRTKYGGSEAVPRAPTQADPRSVVSRSKVDEDIGLRTMWQGYAFAADFPARRCRSRCSSCGTSRGRRSALRSTRSSSALHGSNSSLAC